MQRTIILPFLLAALLSACAYDEPDMKIEDTNFPLRLQIDEEGADLADAENYSIEISFADYIGELPSKAITLTYSLQGEGDFAHVAIDKVFYEYEDEDCVFEREVSFTATTISIPVDADLGTVPEQLELIVAFGLEEDQEVSEGHFTLEITGINTSDNVVFSDADTFKYEILANDVAGQWALQLDANGLEAFQAFFGSISTDLEALDYSKITGEVEFEFEFEEVTIAIELQEEEEVTECKNGEKETDLENLVIEIEADYDAEDGNIEFEGAYYTEDGEEQDFVAEATYTFDNEGNCILNFSKLIDENHFKDGDELYIGSISFTLIKD